MMSAIFFFFCKMTRFYDSVISYEIDLESKKRTRNVYAVQKLTRTIGFLGKM